MRRMFDFMYGKSVEFDIFSRSEMNFVVCLVMSLKVDRFLSVPRYLYAPSIDRFGIGWLERVRGVVNWGSFMVRRPFLYTD